VASTLRPEQHGPSAALPPAGVHVLPPLPLPDPLPVPLPLPLPLPDPLPDPLEVVPGVLGLGPGALEGPGVPAGAPAGVPEGAGDPPITPVANKAPIITATHTQKTKPPIATTTPVFIL